MLYDYAAWKTSLVCLYGLDAFCKIEFLVWFRIVTHVPLSGEDAGRQNYLRRSASHLYGAALKRDTSYRGMY
ncbi:hypothetical protein TNCV_2067841 [Trichonephila clavipes]|uniref:Uncharacterized protein n=1 Tax=Trichonephila clavipes TaxID=2585209 RepID=A0A8X6W2W6_TRICX|nr:hypothetical protein TNCV_2067841 [Trichonephila clavipes]